SCIMCHRSAYPRGRLTVGAPSGRTPPYFANPMHWRLHVRLYSRLFLCLFVLSLSALAAAQPAGKSEALRATVQKFVDDGELPGVVTFVGNKDGVIDVQVLGLADLEKKAPMRRDTLFRIASMTKPITALAVMQLVEEGKVNVEDPVEKYLPEFKGQM